MSGFCNKTLLLTYIIYINWKYEKQRAFSEIMYILNVNFIRKKERERKRKIIK